KGTPGTNLSTHLEPTHVREHQIKDHKVRRTDRNHVKRLAACCRSLNDVVPPAQTGPQGPTDPRLIIHDEDSLTCHQPGSSSRGSSNTKQLPPPTLASYQTSPR